MGSSSSHHESSDAHVAPSDVWSLEEQATLEGLYRWLAPAGTGAPDKEKFEQRFGIAGVPWFAPRLRSCMEPKSAGANGASPGAMSVQQFMAAVAVCCRDRRREQLMVLFRLSSQADGPSRSPEQLGDLFLAAHAMSRASWGLEAEAEHFDAAPLAQDVLAHANGGHLSAAPDRSEGVGLEAFVAWATEKAPLLHLTLATFMQKRCFPDTPPPSSMTLFQPVTPTQPSQLLNGRPAQVLALAMYSRELQGPWLRLYTSDEDGLSFNRLCYKILGYGGPTLLLVADRTGGLFGGYAGTAWKESNGFYGGPDCFLMQLIPAVALYPAKVDSDSHFMYLNLKGFSLPHGLGMGGEAPEAGSFRFFISESMEPGSCRARPNCLTFERGRLCGGSSSSFEVDALEVWGVGEAVQAALEAQVKAREITAGNIARARKVDKAAFADNEFDREFLLGKTFGGGGFKSSAADQRQGNS